MRSDMSIPRLLSILARFERRPGAQFPSLVVLTDQARGFALNHQVQIWPRGTTMLERTYGAPPTPKPKHEARSLRLATCTPKEARCAGLDGIHWPNKRLKYRKRSDIAGLIETASVHSGLDIAMTCKQGISYVLLSTAFASRSPSARRPLGAVRVAILCRRFPDIRFFVLGGITATTAKKLLTSGAYGVALVGFGK